ncbi:MAG: dTMP kinase [bacterium]
MTIPNDMMTSGENTSIKKRGKFIVIEGGEGAGKSSQLKSIKEIYGDKVIVTREPGGTPFAEEIRHLMLKSEHAGQADAKTQFALIWAARADHLKNKIIPALESGINVISDRFDSSTYAYQIYGQDGEELEDLFWKIRDFYLGDIKPDIYMYLDVTAEEGLRRKSFQGIDENNHFDNRKTDFHNKVREAYMSFIKKVPSMVIDANPSKDEVRKKLVESIDKILGE